MLSPWQAEKDSEIAILHEKLAYGQQGPYRAPQWLSGVSDTDECVRVPPEEEMTSWELAGRASLYQSDGGRQNKYGTDAYEEGSLLEVKGRQGIDGVILIKDTAAESSAEVHGIPAAANALSEMATVKEEEEEEREERLYLRSKSSQESRARSARQPRVLPIAPTRMQGSI
jgi:hypothetical protein